MAPEHQKSFMNQSHSFSVGNQVQFAGKPLGFNMGLSYSNKFNYTDNGFIGRYKLIDGADEALSGQLTLDTDEKGTNEVIWAVLVNANYKLSNNHKIGILLLRNQSGKKLARYQDGEKSSDEAGMLYQTRTLQYLQRSFTSGQIKGEHYFKNLAKLKINWLSSLTISKQVEPDLRFFTNHYYINKGQTTYEISQSLYPVPTRYYRNMEEINLDNKIYIEIPFKFRENSSKIKTGASFGVKDREFIEKKFSFNENSNSYSGDILTYLNDNNINAGEGKIFVTNSVSSDNKNSYNGFENVFGAYLMADLRLHEKLRMVTGLRMEKTYIFTESLKADQKKGKLDNLDFIPSINLTYSIEENMNFRLAYNRTLARPTFRELAPFASLDFVGDFVFIGNSVLKRTLIDNFDIRWEYFFKHGEMVSLSGFYKKFMHPIERTFNTEAANPELTLRNVDQAEVIGIEVEVRKTLDFIDFFKSCFSVGGNFSYVKSLVNIDPKELSLKREFDPDFNESRVMFGQAPYTVNAYVSYANDSLRMAANLSFNISGERLFLVNAVGIPDVFEQPRGHLDFNISKKISKKISIKLSVKNLLDNDFKKTYYYKKREYIFDNCKHGRFYSLGFSYSIK